MIEDGNPADATLYRPMLDACQADYQSTPESVVADGGYASHNNVRQACQLGVKRALFNKSAGLGLHEMGVKEKTFAALRNFRAGVAGNISELKRVFGLDQARWKGQEGLQERCVNQGLHSPFATDERGHLPPEFIRPGYSQKMLFLDGH